MKRVSSFAVLVKKRLLLSSYFGLLLHELWRRHLLWIFIIFHLMCVSCLFFLFLLPLPFHRHFQQKERRYFLCLWKPYTCRILFVVLFFCHSTRFVFLYISFESFFPYLKNKNQKKKENLSSFSKTYWISFLKWEVKEGNQLKTKKWNNMIYFECRDGNSEFQKNGDTYPYRETSKQNVL